MPSFRDFICCRASSDTEAKRSAVQEMKHAANGRPLRAERNGASRAHASAGAAAPTSAHSDSRHPVPMHTSTTPTKTPQSTHLSPAVYTPNGRPGPTDISASTSTRASTRSPASTSTPGYTGSRQFTHPSAPASILGAPSRHGSTRSQSRTNGDSTPTNARRHRDLGSSRVSKSVSSFRPASPRQHRRSYSSHEYGADLGAGRSAPTGSTGWSRTPPSAPPVVSSSSRHSTAASGHLSVPGPSSTSRGRSAHSPATQTARSSGEFSIEVDPPSPGQESDSQSQQDNSRESSIVSNRSSRSSVPLGLLKDALSAAANVVDGIPIPGLRVAIRGILEIIDRAKMSNSNAKSARRLLAMIEFLDMIAQRLARISTRTSGAQDSLIDRFGS
ncbi:hypothetical protein FA95DRAFT_55893 [Auriscalpium vulgare]|uniref:Uncharacterized protein n=1 Tax=Auriscalpium vulgare TaxID=40419 RepID=A0ACB8S7C3_9AGAM|nr:hypothetical protein FA95DRAFT_55893 [Auriscalpium vulgare]